MRKLKLKFITLQKASEMCEYSQEYLSLRARQGKLKSKKIGRNWYTTENWLKEYLESVNNGYRIDIKNNFNSYEKNFKDLKNTINKKDAFELKIKKNSLSELYENIIKLITEIIIAPFIVFSVSAKVFSEHIFLFLKNVLNVVLIILNNFFEVFSYAAVLIKAKILFLFGFTLKAADAAKKITEDKTEVLLKNTDDSVLYAKSYFKDVFCGLKIEFKKLLDSFRVFNETLSWLINKKLKKIILRIKNDSWEDSLLGGDFDFKKKISQMFEPFRHRFRLAGFLIVLILIIHIFQNPGIAKAGFFSFKGKAKSALIYTNDSLKYFKNRAIHNFTAKGNLNFVKSDFKEGAEEVFNSALSAIYDKNSAVSVKAYGFLDFYLKQVNLAGNAISPPFVLVLNSPRYAANAYNSLDFNGAINKVQDKTLDRGAKISSMSADALLSLKNKIYKTGNEFVKFSLALKDAFGFLKQETGLKLVSLRDRITGVSEVKKDIRENLKNPEKISLKYKASDSVSDIKKPEKSGVKEKIPLKIAAIKEKANEISEIYKDLNNIKSPTLKIEKNSAVKPVYFDTILAKIDNLEARFLSKEDLDSELNKLNNKILGQISDLKNLLAQTSQANFNATALSNRINQIYQPIISSPTISSPVISTPTISGSASLETLTTSGLATLNSLSVSGNSVLNSALSVSATTTLAGDLRVDTNTLVIDALNNRIGVGTTSPQYALDVDGVLRANSIVANGQTIGGNFIINDNTTLGDATSSDLVFINSRFSDSLIPSSDNLLDLGGLSNWLRWRTGYFGTSVGIGGIATSTGSQLTTSGSYLLDSNGVLSLNTLNNKNIITGAGNFGVGTSSPSAKFAVSGNGYFDGGTLTASSYIATSTLIVSGLTSLANASTSQLTVAGNLWINGFATTTSLNGNIATQGTLTLANIGKHMLLTSDGFGVITASSTPTASNYFATSTNATSTFQGVIVAGSGGAFGVGTSTPSSFFSVLGNSYLTGNLGIGNSNGLNKLNLAGNAGIGTNFINTAAPLNGMIVEGNVGFGTSTPSTNLSVQGNGLFSGNLAVSGIIATSTLTVQSTNATSTFSTGGLTVGTNQFVVQQTSGNVGIGTTSPNWIFSVNGSGNGFAINSSGNVVQGGYQANTIASTYGGTGTSSPYQFLFGNGSGIVSTSSIADTYIDNNLTIANGTISGAVNTISLGSDATGDIYYRSSSGYLTRLAIGTGGYTLASANGLPSWVATSTLSTISGTLANTQGGTGQNSSSWNGPISVANGVWSATSSIGVQYGGTGLTSATAGYTLIGNTATALSATSSLFVSTAGNVGIGTTGPSANLDVYSAPYSTNSTSYFTVETNAKPLFRVLSAASGAATEVLVGGDNANHWLQVSGAYATPLILDSGLGGADRDTFLQYSRNGVARWKVGKLANNDFALLDANSSTQPFTVQYTTGSVGIGTTSPNWNLQVAGVRPFIALSDTGAAANQKHWFLSSQGGNFYVGTSSDALATSTVSKLTINSNGLLGLASSSPSAMLTVAGSSYLGTGTNDTLTIHSGIVNYPISSTTTIPLSVNAWAIATTTATGNPPLLSFDGVNGRVSIGNASPGNYKLYIEGSVASNSGIRGSSFYQYSGNTSIINDSNGNSIVFTTNNGSNNERMRIISSGNIGIGTSTPFWNLQIASSSKTFLTLSDMSAGTNQKHWFLSSQGGNFYIGTSSDSYATSTISAIGINANGYVGIATTSPAVNLAVGGHCVTGDTRLRRRRKRRKADGSFDYEYDEIEIKDIMPGDEIASLDETTGKIVWSRVNGLLDMGVKEIFKLTTASGKTIRTTGNHPYLAEIKRDSPKQKLFSFEIDQSVRIEELNKDTIIAIANNENSFVAAIPRKLKRSLNEIFRKQGEPKKFAPALFASAITNILIKSNFKFNEIIIDIEYPGHNREIAGMINLFFPELKINFNSIGKKSLAHFEAYGAYINKRNLDIKLNQDDLFKIIETKRNSPRTVTQLDKSQLIRSPHRLSLILSIAKTDILSSVREWTKVIYLKKGQRIAVSSENGVAVWDTITKIERLPPEQVYDIEVEGTHNFVAGHYINTKTGKALTEEQEKIYYQWKISNDEFLISNQNPNRNNINHRNLDIGHSDISNSLGQLEQLGQLGIDPKDIVFGGIVAHNTYITGGLGVGTIEQTNGNITGTGRLSITTTNATSTFSTGGLTIGTNQLVVQQTSGNVGIGTTAPSRKLDVQGTFQAESSGSSFGGLNVHGNLTDATAFATDVGGVLGLAGYIDATGSAGTRAFAAIKGGKENANSGNQQGYLSLFSRPSVGNLTERLRIDSAGNVGIGTTSPSQLLSVQGNAFFSGNIMSVANITATGTVSFNEAARLSGSSPLFSIVGGADTGLTVSTEAPDIQFNFARTKTHSTGALTLQRDFLINAATHASANYGSNITDLATLGITGAPLTGINATTTNAYTIYLGASALNASTTNSYGLTVNANTGATNNYAAAFLGGNVGIGTTSPNWLLQAAGTRPSFVLSDTSSNANLKHWFLSSQGGNLYVGTSSDAYSTSTISALTINSNSRIGVGTTSPFEKLSVQGGLAADYLTITGATNATSTFSTGGLNIGNGQFVVQQTSGNVGVGTTAPAVDLHIYRPNPSTSATMRLGSYNVSYYTDIINSTTGSGDTYINNVGTAASAENIYFQNNGVTNLTVKGSGNVGIGTTTPNWLLQVAGTRPSLALSDTSAAVNSKHWLLSSMGGNLYVGTSTDAYATSTPAALTILNNGNVGIGVTNPTRELQVLGTVKIQRASDSAQFLLQRTGANTKEFLFGVNASGANNGYFQIADYGAAEESNPVARLVVDNTGNVGIGTTTPNWLLQVAGTRPSLALSDTSAAVNSKHWLLSSMGGNLYVGTSTDAYATSTPAALTILNNGNVGIGTTSPDRALTVFGAGSWTNNIGVAHITDNGSYGAGLTLETQGAGGKMYSLISGTSVSGVGGGNFGVFNGSAGTYPFVITNGGNVGIGTTGPVGKLNLGNVAAGDAPPKTYTNGQGDGLIIDSYYDSTNSYLSNVDFVAARSSSGTAGGSQFRFITQPKSLGNPAVAMLIDKNGNVGIGTTTPKQLLSIAGITGGGGISLDANSSEVPALRMSRLSTELFYIGGNSGVNSNFDIYNEANGFMRFGTNNLERVRIDSTGNVGIGTTTPNWLLQAAGTRPSFVLSDTSAGTNLKHWFLSSQGGNLYVGTSSDAYATTTYLTVANGGNVGIGTTNPGSKLEVTGDIRLTSSSNALRSQYINLIKENNFGYSTAAYHSVQLGAGSAINFGVDVSAIAGGSFTGSNELILPNAYRITQVNAGGTDFINPVMGFNNGNVGIGTAAPNSKLHVYNGNGGSVLRLQGGSGVDTARLEFSHGNGTEAVVGDIRAVASTLSNGAESVHMTFSTINTGTLSEKVRITNTGNLGIGTTSPSQLLSVAGSGYLTGGLGVGQVETTNGNITGTGQLTITGASATSTFAGGLAIKTSGLVYDWQTNKVGIGTAAPGAKLDIYTGTTGPVLRVGGLATGSSNDASIDLYAAASGNPTYARIGLGVDTGTLGAESGYLTLSTINSGSLTEKVRITKEGNVGIGTTTPNWLLQTAGTQPKFVLSDTSAGTNQKHWFLSSQGGNFYVGTSSDAYATTTYLTVANGGKVGIGTTAPANALHLAGFPASSNEGIRIDPATGGNALIGFGGTTIASAGNPTIYSDNSYLVLNSKAGGKLYLNFDNTAAASDIDLFNGKAVFKSGGNVGIGTTTSNWLLQVNGTRPLFTISDFSSAANLKHWFISSQGGNFYVGTSSDAYSTSTIPAFMISKNGNIGMGTTSPQSKLSIEGTCIDTGPGCADIAELYKSSEDTETGDIMAVDLNNKETVKIASQGDALIGIVSSNPAMTIEGSALEFLTGTKYENNPRKPAIALNGRVPVKVSLEGGEIRQGDRIALSSIPGIGMKATSSGMTVGVALENFNGENSTTTVNAIQDFKTGKILVFVNLGYSKLDLAANDLEKSLIVDSASGKIKSSYALDMDNHDIINVRNILAKSGKWSLDENGKLSVQSIETQELKVGTPDKPNGITIYDEDTGAPYCIKMKAGQMVSTVGECGSSGAGQINPTQSANLIQSVADTEPPIITINGNNPATIAVGAVYSDLGAVATDNISKNLGVHFKVDGVEVQEILLDTSTSTTHTITYTATDEAGNMGMATREVIVQ